MNINKMIREEFHKILKEEDPPPPPAGQEGGEKPEENPWASFMNKAWNYVKDAGSSALAPAAQPAAAAAPAAQKEVVFKNDRERVKKIDSTKYAGKPLPGCIGLMGRTDGRLDTADGFEWVHPEDDYEGPEMYWVKTSDPAIIKKYSRKPLKPRLEVLELQKLINKWLRSSLNPENETYRGMEKSKRSKANEDGLWGPKTQRGLNHIRKFDTNMPPDGSGIPKIITYLKNIESKMVAAQPAQPAQPAGATPPTQASPTIVPGSAPSSPPAAQATNIVRAASGQTGENLAGLPQFNSIKDAKEMYANLWKEKKLPTNQIFHFVAGNRHYQLVTSPNPNMSFDEMLGRGNLTSEPINDENVEGDDNLDESKLIRKIIIQEVRKALRK